MKSPQELLALFDPYMNKLVGGNFSGDISMSELQEVLVTIQQDAFDSGRLSGLNEAGDLCQSHEQTKTEYMIRLHNLIHENSQIVVTPTGSGYNFGAKITIEPK